MKKSQLVFIVVSVLLLVGCQQKTDSSIQVITPEELLSEMETEESVQLIDVRTSEEFFEGHIGSAQNICITEDDFEEKVKLLDKSKPVYVYCRTGGRSARAAKKLQEMGFSKIYDMQGGIQLWQQKELDVE